MRNEIYMDNMKTRIVKRWSVVVMYMYYRRKAAWK